MEEVSVGARFRLEHVNFISYLTSLAPVRAPVADRQTLHEFLQFLRYGLPDDRLHLISGEGAWAERVIEVSDGLIERLNRLDSANAFLQSSETEDVLSPLRKYFSKFLLYSLILFGRAQQLEGRDGDQFRQMAILAGDQGLVLLPESYGEFVDIIDPFPPLRALAENPLTPPVVVFWTPQGSACVETFDSGFEFFLDELLPGLRGDRGTLDRLIAARPKKISRQIRVRVFSR